MHLDWTSTSARARARAKPVAVIVAAQYAYMVSSDRETPFNTCWVRLSA